MMASHALQPSAVERGNARARGLGHSNRFLERLALASLSEWLDIGRTSQELDRQRPLLILKARAHLRANIAECGLDLAAWFARDAVETLAYLARHSTRCQSHSNHALLAAARRAAVDAASATLPSIDLPRPERDALLAPFPACIAADGALRVP